MRKLLAIFILVLLAPLAFGNSNTANSGAGTDGLGGGAAWINPNNITVSGQRASSAIAKSSFSNNLFCETFGFSVPGTATIIGISAVVSKSVAGGASLLDNGIFLLKAGAAAGTDHSAGDWAANSNYGGGTDLWGAVLVPADVNAAGFGISMSAANPDSSFSHTAYVNAFVSMTVTFTMPSNMGRRPIIQYSQTRSTGIKGGR